MRHDQVTRQDYPAQRVQQGPQRQLDGEPGEAQRQALHDTASRSSGHSASTTCAGMAPATVAKASHPS